MRYCRKISPGGSHLEIKKVEMENGTVLVEFSTYVGQTKVLKTVKSSLPPSQSFTEAFQNLVRPVLTGILETTDNRDRYSMVSMSIGFKDAHQTVKFKLSKELLSSENGIYVQTPQKPFHVGIDETIDDMVDLEIAEQVKAVIVLAEQYAADGDQLSLAI